jgi:putative endonuclease
MTANSSASHLKIGHLAEALVAQWIGEQGGEVLHRRWHCRWGELDLIALIPGNMPGSGQPSCDRQFVPAPPSALAFIEVKARSRGNWDATGLLAVTPQKQAKLWQAATLFLAEYPDLADVPCRFDVALVRCDRLSSAKSQPVSRAPASPANSPTLWPSPIMLGCPVMSGSYRLTLQQYLPAAFGL